MVEVEYYESENGKCPYLEWESKLDRLTEAVVHVRLARLRMGHFGDAKSLKGFKGLYELRIHYGPGCRLYYGRKGNALVLLLCGGSKGSQKRDINQAKKLWIEYLESRG